MLTYDIEGRAGQPIYQWLYEKIKQDILEGRLRSGEKLPSKRSLARNLKISVITVENAYAQLMVEGYIYAREKRGYYVDELEERLFRPQKRRKIDPHPIQEESILDLTANHLLPDNFPFSVWSRVMRCVLSQEQKELLKRSPYQGVWRLREAIARHLYHFRGMCVEPECIVLGAGTESLYGQLIQLLGREAIYGIEEPGYQKIGKIYEKNQVCTHYLPLDDSGMSLQALRQMGADVIHISPGHHFPTGRVMPIRRRQELLRWAQECPGRYIIEDDYDSEFRFSGRPIPTLESIDEKERVIYMNTFSKTISPSIRISYMILPSHLMEKYHREMSFYACAVPTFEQYTLAEFMDRGYLEKHINRMRKYYRGLRDEAIELIEQSRLSEYLEILEEDAGLHFLLRIHTSRNRDEVKALVRRARIRLFWLDEYYHVPPVGADPVAVINYSGVHREELAAGIRQLEKMVAGAS